MVVFFKLFKVKCVLWVFRIVVAQIMKHLDHISFQTRRKKASTHFQAMFHLSMKTSENWKFSVLGAIGEALIENRLRHRLYEARTQTDFGI